MTFRHLRIGALAAMLLAGSAGFTLAQQTPPAETPAPDAATTDDGGGGGYGWVGLLGLIGLAGLLGRRDRAEKATVTR